MIFIVFGVSGVGKTSIGQEMALKLNLPFYDADDYHPRANIAKMQSGQSLNDGDREPWLDILSENIRTWSTTGGVLACSALKEKYRVKLRSRSYNNVEFVFLDADKSTIFGRLQRRTDHFMKPNLLDSQLADLEIPDYGIHLDANQAIDHIINEFLVKMKAEFGIVGLGVMGKSLALNIAGKGISLSAYNRHIEDKEVDIAKNFATQNGALNIKGYDDLHKFVQSLQTPRSILLMVNAGKPVDIILENLIPLLDKDDLIIDAGNSHYEDTKRRINYLHSKHIHFLGMGVSGGEEGALKGPSMMPSGSKEGHQRIAHILNAIAAKDKNGQACTTYVGPEGSGHFVKMIHNGIEYAEMQLIAEVYHFLRFHYDMKPEEIADLFSQWYADGLASYLLEITIDILRTKEGNLYMIDLIQDKAGQKGTGGWSTMAALALDKPLNTISEAVMARCLSAMKDIRVQASQTYQSIPIKVQNPNLPALKNTYQAARIINHAIGFDTMHEASEEFKWNLNLADIARIWTNGCIIRSALMQDLIQITKESPKHILLHPSVVNTLKTIQPQYAQMVGQALEVGCSIPVLSSALNYFLSFKSAQSSANMIQAQRDYFGAHTFIRVDKLEEPPYHHIWNRKTT